LLTLSQSITWRCSTSLSRSFTGSENSSSHTGKDGPRSRAHDDGVDGRELVFDAIPTRDGDWKLARCGRRAVPGLRVFRTVLLRTVVPLRVSRTYGSDKPTIT
jgi:hypothetical protein